MKPARVIVWPAVGEPVIVARSDGAQFMAAVFDESSGSIERELARAQAWGREPGCRPPSGWRDAPEFDCEEVMQ